MSNNNGQEYITHLKQEVSKIADTITLDSLQDVRKKIGINDNLVYISNDTLAGDPTLLLGRVYWGKKENNQVEGTFITGVEAQMNEKSALDNPVLRTEIILNKKLSSELKIMSYFDLKVEDNQIIELNVIDTAAGSIDNRNSSWRQALTDWQNDEFTETHLENPEYKHVGIVIGFVQKTITAKRYKEFKGNTKGGAFGVYAGGSLYLSTSEYECKNVYGLDISWIPASSSSELLTHISGNIQANKKDSQQLRNNLENLAVTSFKEGKGLV